MTRSKFGQELATAVSSFFLELARADKKTLPVDFMRQELVKKQKTGIIITLDDVIDGFDTAHKEGIKETKDIVDLCGGIAPGHQAYVTVREIASSLGMPMEGKGRSENLLNGILNKASATAMIDARRAVVEKIRAKRQAELNAAIENVNATGDVGELKLEGE